MHQEKNDIKNREDIERLVDQFYSKVQADQLIGPVFNQVIKDQWPAHLEKMYRFWETVLLDNKSYFGSPFPPHAKLPVDKNHFDTWLKLWRQTLDAHFSGPVADEAKWRADKMAVMFLSKIEYYRHSGRTPLL